MNTTLIFLMPLIMALSNGNPIIDKENCTCNGIKLYGKVKVVETHADLKAKVVSTHADLKVKVVPTHANNCGQWEFVEVGYELKVEFVEAGYDLKIEYVDFFPGIQ